MDETRFKKVEREDVIKMLQSGYHLFDKNNMEYKLNETGLLIERETTTKDFFLSGLAFNDLLIRDLYTARPFDVRSAMMKTPNEWVGKYPTPNGWRHVGFDTKHFNAICKGSELHLPVDTDIPGVSFPTSEELDDCIPI